MKKIIGNYRIYIWTIIFFLSALLVMGIFFTFDALKTERTLFGWRDHLDKIANSIKESSNELTRSVRAFMISGDTFYLQSYWEEKNIKQTSDKAIQAAINLHLPANELSLLSTANKKLNELVNTDIRAMKLILLAMGLPEERMYPEIKNYKLAAADLNLSNQEKVNFAQRILADEAYVNARESITLPIEDFKREINERITGEINRDQDKTNFYFLMIKVLSILVLLLIILMLWTRIP